MKVELSRRAQRQIDGAEVWWQTHRDKAPDAFDADLRSAFDLLIKTPSAGRPVRTRSGPARRLTLGRIRYYLYYRVVGDRIRILSLWHTSRRPPRL